MTRDAWDPESYGSFGAARARPFFDLLGMLPEREPGVPAPRVVDLGCGTGELTRALLERADGARVLGLDTSSAMLRKVPRGVPGLAFVRADLRRPPLARPVDLLFSNAALHWIDDQPRLLSELLGHVAPGGWIAVQVPANHDHFAYRAAAALAGEEPFRTALGGWVRRSPVLAPEEYAALLDGLGLERIEVVLRVYGERVDSTDDILRWIRGALLTAYEARLAPELFAEYVERLSARLAAAPEGRRRPLYWSFKRILFVGRRPLESVLPGGRASAPDGHAL